MDADACRALNIRSIAAVPVQSGASIIGILEVFSSSPRRLTEEQIEFLSSLAGLVERTSATADNRPSPFWGARRFLERPRWAELTKSLLTGMRTLAPWRQMPKRRYSLLAGMALSHLFCWRTGGSGGARK